MQVQLILRGLCTSGVQRLNMELSSFNQLPYFAGHWNVVYSTVRPNSEDTNYFEIARRRPEGHMVGWYYRWYGQGEWMGFATPYTSIAITLRKLWRHKETTVIFGWLEPPCD